MKNDTAMNWATSNPVISANEYAYETDTGIFKEGNGTTRYNSLPISGRDLTGIYADAVETTSALAEKAKISPIGGVLVQMVNKTGAASVKGTLIACSTTADNAFEVEEDEFDCIGVAYESGIADGALTWVVVDGIAEVLLKDTTASTRGNWVKAADTNGRADATLTVPSAPGTVNELNEHFKEIGHCLESKEAGTNVICKAALHFN